jgi:hypothetical protein
MLLFLLTLGSAIQGIPDLTLGEWVINGRLMNTAFAFTLEPDSATATLCAIQHD